MPSSDESCYHSRGRIVAISASVGAGHDGATRELARRLRKEGFDVDCYDFLTMLPWRIGNRVAGTHSAVLRRVPSLYGALFGFGRRFAFTAPVTRALLSPARRRIVDLLSADVRAVISTYPLGSQVLGPLRHSGRLMVPALMYLTDFGVHRFWVSRGIDTYIALNEISAAQARGLDANGVRVASPLVSPGCHPTTPAGKCLARQQFGLPPGRLALVVAGSWGVGNLQTAAAEIARTRAAIPVVACGRNERLRRRLLRQGVRHVFGWVDDMPTLMRAADVLVENAGGLMALEAMACGLPVLTYRPIPGHGTGNAAALARAGVSTWVRRTRDLGPALIELAGGERGRRQCERALALFDREPADTVVETIGDLRPPASVVG